MPARRRFWSAVARREPPLRVLYEGGSGVLKDLARSAALYEKGCEGGYPLGCTNLAELNAHGVGVPQDHARAAALFERACNGGDTTACKRRNEMKQ
jgi:TPR repeat protein